MGKRESIPVNMVQDFPHYRGFLQVAQVRDEDEQLAVVEVQRAEVVIAEEHGELAILHCVIEFKHSCVRELPSCVRQEFLYHSTFVLELLDINFNTRCSFHNRFWGLCRIRLS